MKNCLNILALVLGMVLAFSATSCKKSEDLSSENEKYDKEYESLHIQIKYSVVEVMLNGVDYFYDCRDVHAVKVLKVPKITLYNITKLEGEKVTAAIHFKNWTYVNLGEFKTVEKKPLK